MIHKEKIEKAVSEYFKVPVKEIYANEKKSYPYNGAKKILMYMLYENGMKVYNISKLFGLSDRTTYHEIAEVSVALRDCTKIKEDIKYINNNLNIK